MSYLTDYEIDGGYVTFGGNLKGGKITGKDYEIDGGYVAFGGNLKGGKITGKEAVNTACYVQNRVLVVKPHNKTPYELFHGRTPIFSFMRPFGCPDTILDTIDRLGKFDSKADEGSGPDWLFDIDALTRTMNYEPIVAGTQSNGFAGTKASDNAGQARKETEPVKDYILLPLWTADPPFSQDLKSSHDDGSKPSSDDGKRVDEDPRKESEYIGIFDFSSDHKDDGAMADINNLDTIIQVSPILTIRIHKDHPLDQVIGDLHSATQTRKMSKNLEEHGFVSTIQQRTNHKDLQNFLFACFLSQEEPKKIPSQSKGFTSSAVKKIFSARNKHWLQIPQQNLNMWLLQVVVDKRFGFRISHLIMVLVYCYGQNYQWESQIHAKVDGKKIIITESSVRRYLRLADKEDHQLDRVPTHKRTFSAPYHTKKIFDNMRRIRKGFSGRVTRFFPTMVVQKQSKMGEGSAMPIDPYHIPTILQPSSSQPQKTQKPRKPQRKDTQVPQPSDPINNVADEAVHKDLGDSLVKAATTAFSLEVEHDSGNTLRSDEDRMKLNELMALCTNLQTRVLELEKTKTTQHNKITSLKRRVKNLENRNSSKTHKLKRLYKVGWTARVECSDDEEGLGEDASKQGRIKAIDEYITLVNDDADKEMFDVNVLDGEEVFVARKSENVIEEVVDAAQVGTATTTVTITTKKITFAQALEALKTLKPKDKGKGIMVEEAAKRLQAEFNEEERLAREKAEKEQEANIALIETYDDIQTKIDVDHQLAERLQVQEQEELFNAKKATLFSTTLREKKEDLEDLYKLVKAKFKSTRPVEDFDLLLLGDLKTIFEPHVKDNVWKMQQGYKVLIWKLYDSRRVHFLMMQYMQEFNLLKSRINHEEDDEVIKELYDDVNVNLGNDDTEMTDANQGEKADEPLQSSSVSSDFTSKFLNLKNSSPVNNEIASLMETSAPHATAIPEITSCFTTTTPPPPSFFNPLLQKQTPTFTTITSKIQQGQDDQDKDEDPFTGSDQAKKRRKSGKDAESSKESRYKEKKSSSTSKDASQSQHKSFRKFVYAEEPSHTIEESGMQQDQEFVTGNNDEQPLDKEIEDLVPKLWSLVVVNYDQHAYFSTSHWGPKRQSFYGYASNLTSSKDVYSRRRIIAVTRLTIMEKYDYSHLEEIECKKQIVVENSTTEAEYVATSSCCGHDKQKKSVSLVLEMLLEKELELMLFWTTAKSKIVNEVVQIHVLVDGMNVVITESSVRRDLQLADEDGGGDSLVRATTTVSSLEAEQAGGNIAKTQTKATSNEPSIQRTSLGDGPRRQDTMEDTFAHTRYETVSKMSTDSLLTGVNTPRSDEDSLKHIELIKIYTTLQKKVLDLEDEPKRTKTVQQSKIDGLERRFKKLKKKHWSRTHKLKRLYKVSLTAREDTSKQGRIGEIDTDEDIALAPNWKGVMIQEPEETTTTTKTASSQLS
nr:retrovirus-related Pol polyprotein from transposon TNT 1-94 [Tanacetum cinerariifolium]